MKATHVITRLVRVIQKMGGETMIKKEGGEKLRKKVRALFTAIKVKFGGNYECDDWKNCYLV